MATFIVSFRLESDGTYFDRWQSLDGAIRIEATNGIVWDELTSLYIIDSQKGVYDLALSIAAGSDFNVYSDRLVVIDLEQRTTATFGILQDQGTLDALIARPSILNALMALGR